MYIIKNALANLLRNKGRNILIAAIVFAIVTSTVVALIINNTASAEIERYRDKLSSQVHFSPNSEKMQAVMEEQQQEQQEQQEQEYQARAQEIDDLTSQIQEKNDSLEELQEQIESEELPQDQLALLGEQIKLLEDQIEVLEENRSQLQDLQDQYNQMGGRGFFRMRGGTPEIPSESLLKFAESDALSENNGYQISGFLGADSQQIEAIDQSDEAEDSNTGPDVGYGGGGVFRSMRIGGGGNFRLYGGLWEDFTESENKRELIDEYGVSEYPQNEQECLISKELADANGLNVGDTITFQAQGSIDIPDDLDMSGYADGDTIEIGGMTYKLTAMGGGMGRGAGMEEFFSASRDIEVTLTVTGVYADYNSEYADEGMADMGFAAMNRRNEILMTLDGLLALRAEGETGIRLEGTYYLKNPDLLDEFAEFAYANGLDDVYDVTTDSEAFDAVTKPVESMRNFSVIFMVIVLALGGIILFLLTSIAIRERKYEIGVLRAMGMKKKKVALGLWSELLVVTCACLVVGIAVGSLVAQPVTDMLLEQQQTEQPDTQSGTVGGRQIPGGQRVTGGGPGAIRTVSFLGESGGDVSPVSSMDVMVDVPTILEIIGIALALATLAGLLSLTKITKYEPIKILMERN